MKPTKNFLLYERYALLDDIRSMTFTLEDELERVFDKKYPQKKYHFMGYRSYSIDKELMLMYETEKQLRSEVVDEYIKLEDKLIKSGLLCDICLGMNEWDDKAEGLRECDCFFCEGCGEKINGEDDDFRTIDCEAYCRDCYEDTIE